jgi:glycerophosphoryl diester phosphodiesterase
MMAYMRSILSLLMLAATGSTLHAASTVWTFTNPANPLTASSGPAELSYYDPFADGWGPTLTSFGKASTLGLPALPGGDADVMAFPACSPQQGFRLAHNAAPNGSYEPDGRTSNYTIIVDVLYPASSDAQWRGLWQTNPDNGDDADFFVANTASGGIGISSNYLGRIIPDQWHRIVITVRSAPGEGHCQRYIDGTFVGGQGTTGSGLDLRWSLGPDALVFTDNDGETAPGYCASFAFIDRALFPAEVAALGGPHAAGALTPGTAPAPQPPMARRVGVVGHRGGAFDRAPDNTLASIRAGIADGVQAIEIDTRLSADGVCIAFHDSTLDRTTDGSGDVSSFSLAELKTFDAGSWYDPSFTGERIPSLAEVLAEAHGKCIIFLDMKTGGQAPAILNAVSSTGFPLSDLWIWTTNATTAAEIRSVIPTARLMWGAPDNSWATDPNYFTSLKAQGAIGFSFGAGNGIVDPTFCAAAKEQGMIVEIFTILTPDAMRNAALSGVDYVENDYPAIMNSLQPPQTPAASAPYPANGATDVPPDIVLRWVTGTNATQRRVFFGTSAPGTDLGIRSSDLLPRANLASGTTYYWRVDEISPSGTTTGPTWSFTTKVASPATLVGLWLFDRPDDPGHASVGPDLVIEGAPPDWSASTPDDTGFAVAGSLRTQAGPGNHFRCPNPIGPNGGGTYTNRYSIVADVYSPPESRGSWRCLLQTNPNNTNDGDYFLRTDERLGVGAIGYSSSAPDPSRWNRIVFSVDITGTATTTALRTIINAGLPFTHSSTGLDGRFSLDSSFLFFGDEDGENNSVQVGMLALYNGPLTGAEITALGATRAEGLFATPSLAITRSGNDIRLAWPATPGYLLERSSHPATPWTPLESTLNASSYTEPYSPAPGRAFFRLAPR